MSGQVPGPDGGRPVATDTRTDGDGPDAAMRQGPGPAAASEPTPEADGREPAPSEDRPEPVAAARGHRARSLLHGLVALWPYAAAAVAALAAALWTYRPWRFGSAVMNPGGDALAFVAWIQNVVESGWYEHGERLSAPFAQNSHTYTLTDELVMGAVGRVLAPLTGSAGAAVTWWLVLTFPLAAVAAVALARYLGLSRVTAVLVGVAFAVLPDHFLRGTGHYALATTWVVPVGLLAAVSLVHRPRHRGRARVVWEAALLVGLVCVTLTSAYYGVFSGLLIAAAGVGVLVARRRWADLGLTALRGAALGVPLVAAVMLDRTFLPSPLGYEAFAVTRGLADAEIYGGKVVAMLLPSSAHRLELFRDLRYLYDSTFPNPAEGPALGLLASVGFVALVVRSVLHHFRSPGDARDRRLDTLAGLTWVALFAYSVGGLGSLWSLALEGGGIRVWSRMHVVIALLALLAVGVAVDRLRSWWRVGAVGVLLVLVALDQTSGLYRFDPAAARAVETEVTELTAAIAERAGDDASVYQYPEVTFPIQHRDTTPATAYDGFLPYLYSTDLQWSYGGLQGDPSSDWQVRLGQRPLLEQAALLRAAGFAGILVDTSSLQSSPDELAELAALGEPDVTSSSGRFEYHDLAPLPAACTAPDLGLLADDAVRPVLAYPGDGLDPIPGGVVGEEPDAELRLVTLRDGGWPDVTVELTVDSPGGPLRLHLPDGSTREVPAGVSEVTWTGDLTRADTAVQVEKLAGELPYTLTGFRTTAVPAETATRCLPAPPPAAAGEAEEGTDGDAATADG